MSILGELLLQVFVQIPLDLIGGGVQGAVAGRKDRRLLRESAVRCGIRASTGRVHNIGTEWSVGTAAISTGRVNFVPRMGIVGDRTLAVLQLAPVGSESAVVGLEGFRVFALSTAKGDLLWAIPPGVADDVVALVAGPSQRPVPPAP